MARLKAIVTDRYEVRPVSREAPPILLWALLGLAAWGLLLGLVFAGIALEGVL